METTTEQGIVLNAFSRALGREAHVLTQHPELMWQQLYNRLQWVDKVIYPLIEHESKFRKEHGFKPWFRTLIPHLESERYSRSFVGHKGRISCCKFTLDGQKIVSGGEDGSIRIWDPMQGTLIAVLQGHEGRVNDFFFLNQSEILISAGADGTLRAWSITTQKSLDTLISVNAILLSCDSAQTSHVIFAGDNKGVLHAISFDKPDQNIRFGISRSSLNSGSAITSTSVAIDGSVVACGHGDGTVSLWDPNSRILKKSSILGKHTDVVFSSCFSPNGSLLATGDGFGKLRVWDWQKQILKYEIKGHSGAIMDCSFTPSGDRLISVGDDSKIRIENYDPSRSTQLVSFVKGHFRPVTCFDISPSEETLVSGSDDGTIRIWDLREEHVEDEKQKQGHDRWVVSSAFSADGEKLITGSRDGDIILWDTETKKIIRVFGPQSKLEWCDLSPSGEYIISSGDGAILWRVSTGNKEVDISWESPIFWCGFAFDGELIVGINISGKQIWDITEPDPSFIQRVVEIPSNASKKLRVTGPDLDFSTIRCDFSPYRSRLVTPGSDGKIGIWEIDADLPFVLGKHEEQVVTCAWDPSGQFIASGGKDGLIKLWNVQDRSLIGTLEGHQGWINHLKYFESGYLISVSSDGNVFLWNTNTKDIVCVYPIKGDVFLSCAAHKDHNLICITDIAGNVHWLKLEWNRDKKG